MKNKMQTKPIRLMLLLLWFLVTAVNGFSVEKENENPVIAGKTKVFLQTDKQIYAPGETMLLFARTFDCKSGKLSDEKELIIMIKGKKGEIIADQKYSLEAGLLSSKMTIPAWVQEGMASVVAFTPQNMAGNEAPLVAVQPILINALQKNDFLVSLQEEDKIYKPGEEVELQLFMTQITPGSSKEKVNLSLIDFKETKLSLKQTLHTGLNKVKVKLPENIDQGLWLEIESASRHFCYAQLPLKTTADLVRIEFFPEGGQLLANSVQKIIYRSTNAFGEPLTLDGKIYDPTGHHVGLGKSLKPGLGLISLMPMPGQVYTFEIEGGLGSAQKFLLPETQTDGVAISYIKTDNQVIRNQVRVVGKYIGQKLDVGITRFDKTLWHQSFIAKEENKMEVPSSDFPVGIITFTVSDTLGRILSERMVYNAEPLPQGSSLKPVIKFEEAEKKVMVDADVSEILKRWPESTFDIRIVDQNALFHKQSMQANGYLRFPLLETAPQTVLDLYITNIELVGNRFHPACLTPDKSKEENALRTITGEVSDKKGRAIAGARVMAFHPDQSAIWNAISDEKGFFSIEGVDKNPEIKVKALDQSGKKSYEVKLYHSFQESLDEILQLAFFRVNAFYNPQQVVSYFNQNRHIIRESLSEYKSNSQAANVERMLQSGSSILDVIRMMKAFNLENNQIVFYGSNNSFNFQSGALIVIDGQKMGTDISAFNAVSPHDVASISVSTDPMDIQKYTGLNSVGVIEIVTRGANVPDRMAGFKESGNAGEATAKPEQTTRLWLPAFNSDNGIFHLVFDPGDLKTNFVLQIDAVTGNGEILSFREVYSNE